MACSSTNLGAIHRLWLYFGSDESNKLLWICGTIFSLYLCVLSPPMRRVFCFLTACGWATPFVLRILPIPAADRTGSDLLWIAGAFFVAYAINEIGTVSIGDDMEIPTD